MRGNRFPRPQVTLHQIHWTVLVDKIRSYAAGVHGGSTPGGNAVIVPPSKSSRGDAGVSAATPVDKEAVDLVLRTAAIAVSTGSHGNVVYPFRMRKFFWTSLRDLLPPRTLKQYIRDSQEFEVVEVQGSHAWGFRFRSGGLVAGSAATGGAGVSAAPPPSAATGSAATGGAGVSVAPQPRTEPSQPPPQPGAPPSTATPPLPNRQSYYQHPSPQHSRDQ